MARPSTTSSTDQPAENIVDIDVCLLYTSDAADDIALV